MRREKQTGFELLEKNNIKICGGSIQKSNPKLKRPLSLKKANHVVLKSLYAKGAQSFIQFDLKIQNIINKQGKKHGVKVYHFGNGGTHLHLMVLPRSRAAFNAFIRSITGLISRLVLGVERGAAKGLKFWQARPFTRIVEWGGDYKEMVAYMLRNKFEALGFIPYRIRNKKVRLKAIEEDLIRLSKIARLKHSTA